MHHKPLTIDATLDTLDWLKETEMATRLETAIARVIAEGKLRTYNMSGRRGDMDSPWRQRFHTRRSQSYRRLRWLIR
jgi:isocitrate/isopropylmalate dehydrogenase